MSVTFEDVSINTVGVVSMYSYCFNVFIVIHHSEVVAETS